MNKDNKKFVIEALFLKEVLKHDLSLNEFVILMYFDNELDANFDVKKISKVTSLSEKDVLSSFGSLLDKKLLILNTIKNENGKMVDKVSLDNLYSSIVKNEKNNDDSDDSSKFINEFQEKYGHSLSSSDYEIIKAWLAHGFSEDLILGALSEANYNGVVSLRYIDKVLFEWQKKGFKSMNDVNDGLKKKNMESNLFETKVLEYNWLDED